MDRTAAHTHHRGGGAAGSDILVWAYYTPGPYWIEADRLAASLRALDLEHKIVELPDRGGWIANRHAQARHLMVETMSAEHTGRAVLIVDADCIFHADPRPALARVGPCDVAFHYLRGEQLLGGTMWVPRWGEPIVDMVAEWARRNAEAPGRRPQSNLADAVAALPLTVGRLPAELCWIFDISPEAYGQRRPIVEHLQASRELASPNRSTGRLRASRRRRLAELGAGG